MKIGVIGHSQLRELNLQNVNFDPQNYEVRKFWQAGARFSCILKTIAFQDLCHFSPDVVITFLGGNDILHNCCPSKIIEDFNIFIKEIRKHFNLSHGIHFLDIEIRIPRSTFYVDLDTYQKVRRSVNGKMRKVRNLEIQIHQ